MDNRAKNDDGKFPGIMMPEIEEQAYLADNMIVKIRKRKEERVMYK